MTLNTRHQCLVYDGPPSQHLPRLVPMLMAKLADNHRCLFLGSPDMVALMRTELSTAGLDLLKLLDRGALILSTDQSHLVNGVFDSDSMLAMLKKTVDQALADGYKGLWATGDMTWEMGSSQNLKRLLEYECGLEKLFRTLHGLSGVCQYHRDTLPLDIVGNALYTHQTVYVSHTLQRVNPYFLQPESLQENPPHPKTYEIEMMLQAVTVPDDHP